MVLLNKDEVVPDARQDIPVNEDVQLDVLKMEIEESLQKLKANASEEKFLEMEDYAGRKGKFNNNYIGLAGLYL